MEYTYLQGLVFSDLVAVRDDPWVKPLRDVSIRLLEKFTNQENH